MDQQLWTWRWSIQARDMTVKGEPGFLAGESFGRKGLAGEHFVGGSHSKPLQGNGVPVWVPVLEKWISHSCSKCYEMNSSSYTISRQSCPKLVQDTRLITAVLAVRQISYRFRGSGKLLSSGFKRKEINYKTNSKDIWPRTAFIKSSCKNLCYPCVCISEV